MSFTTRLIRQKKIEYFFQDVPKTSKVLDVGSGDGWVGKMLNKMGWNNCIGIDTEPPAKIIGSIKDWRALGLKKNSYDFIVAFEVMEHVDCVKDLYDLLRPGGKLAITTPLPHMDWLCFILETLGINQKRTSPHSNLFYLKDLPYFKPIKLDVYGFMVQWGLFEKPKK